MKHNNACLLPTSFVTYICYTLIGYYYYRSCLLPLTYAIPTYVANYICDHLLPHTSLLPHTHFCYHTQLCYHTHLSYHSYHLHMYVVTHSTAVTFYCHSTHRCYSFSKIRNKWFAGEKAISIFPNCCRLFISMLVMLMNPTFGHKTAKSDIKQTL